MFSHKIEYDNELEKSKTILIDKINGQRLVKRTNKGRRLRFLTEDGTLPSYHVHIFSKLSLVLVYKLDLGKIHPFKYVQDQWQNKFLEICSFKLKVHCDCNVSYRNNEVVMFLESLIYADFSVSAIVSAVPMQL